MILHRLKDIIRATINEQVDRFGDSNFDFDFAEWKKYDQEYEEFRQKQQQERRQSGSNYAGSGTTNQEAEYYKVLELPFGTPFDQVKKSYRRLMKMYHPDMFHNDSEKQEIARQISEKLNEAYVYFEKKFGK